jgi:ADP-ribose pyrophosphatase YjhB (NUDIX family)
MGNAHTGVGCDAPRKVPPLLKRGKFMADGAIPLWLRWGREIQAIGQIGHHFSTNPFDRERYEHLEVLASQILAQYSQISEELFLQSFLAQEGYATPKVDVRAAVIKENKILLVRESQDGLWSMPGGYGDINDTPSASAEREVWEESGLRAKARKVIAVFESNHDRAPISVFHAYKVIFLCDLLGGEAKISHETTAVDFFAADELPPLSLNRTQPRYIQEAFAHIADPERATAFD